MALLRQCLAELRSKYGDAEDWAVFLRREGVTLHRPIVSRSQDRRDGVRPIERYRPSVLVTSGSLSANGGPDA